ncbi:caspase family protein [Chroococcidiopsis sp. FACHB-1243]|uniref:caspase family protein n=1 Tax=Chroococcidiopsis sp. [FACHB-1243] TaxID=2692781 RepID=UPI001783634C|nr:caspase family protein [Chroococcidiopsis sp. [FACHB-1243]]MBD2307931.1 caspase family protein [Chroococcidiopsis sp. [FACHB-1243]]
MKRRDFLRRLAQAIATLGVVDAGWLRIGDRYAHALAQPTGRKLALLVGINQYPATLSLGGCLTDVALQRELLVHRFGFNPADILTLTDRQATRKQVEAAFLEHLTQQTKTGDTVVFHFSGYGRRVLNSEFGIRNSEFETTNNQFPVNSLVCADGEDLLDETLWLLLRSLPTRQIATFLDTSFGTPVKILPANLRVRSFPQTLPGQVSAAELAFQQQLQQDFLCQGVLDRIICGSIDASIKPTPTANIPGVAIAAASPTQSAIETAWNGFSAGLFTYALTQHLWEATPATTVQVSLSRVSGTVEQLVGNEQQPQVNSQKNPQSTLTDYLSQEPSISADGVVMAVEEDKKSAQLWLAGLPPTVLAYYEAGSKLNLVPALEQGVGSREQGVGEATTNNQQPTTIQLQVRSRNGLIAKAQVVGASGNDSPQVGQLVQEAVRVLPRNLRLIIALDPSLERIERVDATSAFAAMPFVSLATTSEQLADYVFGLVPPPKSAETPIVANAGSPASRYGLFTLDRQPIPNTAGEFGEAVKVAVQRLSPKLQILLAAKIWRLTTNDGSSHLNVKATLEMLDPENRVLMQRETLRSPQEESPTLIGKLKKQLPTSPDTIPAIPIGSRIQYRVQNNGDRPVHLLLLGLDSSKSAIALYSSQLPTDNNESNSKPILEDIEIAPGETAIVPQSTANSTWMIHKPSGLAEHQLIFSSASFTQTLAVLANTDRDLDEPEHIGVLSNPLDVIQAVMKDLQDASAIAPPRITASASNDAVSPSSDTYALDVNDWASLSFVYQVV